MRSSSIMNVVLQGFLLIAAVFSSIAKAALLYGQTIPSVNCSDWCLINSCTGLDLRLFSLAKPTLSEQSFVSSSYLA